MYFWIESIDGSLNFFTRNRTRFENLGAEDVGRERAIQHLFGSYTALDIERGLLSARLKKDGKRLASALGDKMVVCTLKLTANGVPQVDLIVADPEFPELFSHKALPHVIDWLLASRQAPPSERAADDGEGQSNSRMTLLSLGTPDRS